MQCNGDMMTLTEPNEVFVFGSNIEGEHIGGAARYALDHYGAIRTQGFGLQGRSFAIPTISLRRKDFSLIEINQYVADFLVEAQFAPKLNFIVTPIGCGIAGYTPDQIAPMFRLASLLPNVILPNEFLEMEKSHD